MACGIPAATCGITKVARVQQATGSIRFDIFCKSERSAFVFCCLQHFSARCIWHIRYHRPFFERHPPHKEFTRIDPRQFDQRVAPLQDDNNAQIINDNNDNNTQIVNSNNTPIVNRNPRQNNSNKVDAMALQETLLHSTDFGISIPGYQCFTALGHSSAAQRGVSVMIRSNFGGEVVGPAHSNWTFVRVSGQEIATTTIVGSVYLPLQAARVPAREQLAVDLARLTNEFQETPLVLMGDFNMTHCQLQTLSASWNGVFEVAKKVGDLPTYRKPGGRTVNHICLRSSTLVPEMLPLSKVHQDWDISDHYPVSNKIALLRCPPPRTSPRAQRQSTTKRIRAPEKGEQMESIASSNIWSVLAEDAAKGDAVLERTAAQAQLNHKASNLKTVCHSIAKEMDLENYPRQSGPSVVPTKLRRSINT
jgi:hypothetical protein